MDILPNTGFLPMNEQLAILSKLNCMEDEIKCLLDEYEKIQNENNDLQKKCDQLIIEIKKISS